MARPALLLVDLYRAVFGDAPEPLLQAIKTWPSSCGLAGWNALPHIQRLLGAAEQADRGTAGRRLIAIAQHQVGAVDALLAGVATVSLVVGGIGAGPGRADQRENGLDDLVGRTQLPR